MPRTNKIKRLLWVFVAWLISVSLYGWFEVSKTMSSLAVDPSPDLYANDLEFQVMVFVITKGFASVLVLIVAMVATLRAGHKGVKVQ